MFVKPASFKTTSENAPSAADIESWTLPTTWGSTRLIQSVTAAISVAREVAIVTR